MFPVGEKKQRDVHDQLEDVCVDVCYLKMNILIFKSLFFVVPRRIRLSIYVIVRTYLKIPVNMMKNTMVTMVTPWLLW